MVTALADVEHGKEVGGLARAREHGRRASFERRDLCRDVIVGGVLQARVEVARLLKVEKPPHGVRTVVFEGRGLHNGQLPRLTILGCVACLHAAGLDALSQSSDTLLHHQLLFLASYLTADYHPKVL